MKPLTVKQSAFKADEVTYLDRKVIQLDRMLLKLFELLRFDGRQIVRTRTRTIDVETLMKMMRDAPERFPGFDQHSEVTQAWLTGDLLEMMNRGKPGREMVVGPRPFHLNAFKLSNPKAAADYGSSQQIWAMLYHTDRQLLTRLKEFFSNGVDPVMDRYDMSTPLDVETLAILGLVDQVKVDHLTTSAPEPIRPLCTGQGRLLADDLRRLLAYEHVVPRQVLAGYLRTVMGLHLSLFVLRLFRLVPALVESARSGHACEDCPLDAGGSKNVVECPFHYEMVVDLTEDPNSPIAALARASAAARLESVSAYVRAVILINRLKEFAGIQASAGKRAPAKTVKDLLMILSDPPSNMDGFFEARISDILSNDTAEQEDTIVENILRLEGLSPFEKYVELICLTRMKNERNKLIQMFDSLSQKNRPGGFLKQAAGPRAPRSFVMGGNLLETLVQIAVLEPSSNGRFRSRNLLIDEFTEWLRRRYGFLIYAPATSSRQVAPEDQEAWRLNERALRERLRQIGFFTDLSDAYNSQTLRPRYTVKS